MGQAIAELFWNLKVGLRRDDFLRALTILIILAATATLNFIIGTWVQTVIWSTASGNDPVVTTQFFNGLFLSFDADLFAPTTLFCSVALFVKRAVTLKIHPVAGLVCALLVFLLLRIPEAILSVSFVFSAGNRFYDSVAPFITPLAVVLGFITVAGLTAILVFLFRKDPAGEAREPMDRKHLSPNGFARAYWKVGLLTMLSYVAAALVFVAAATALNLSWETGQVVMFSTASAVSVGGQVALFVIMSRRLRDAGLSPWIIFYVYLGITMIAALLVWGIASHLGPIWTPPMMFVLRLFLDVPAVGCVALLLLPNRSAYYN